MNGFPYGGYAGKLLRVDLTTRTVQDEPLRAVWAESFLGGRGLGARLFFAEVGFEVQSRKEKELLPEIWGDEVFQMPRLLSR
jgi:aldehyde:ferredoxin oxidoreductase